MLYQELTKEEIIQYRGYRNNIKGDKFSLYISNYPINARYLASRIGNTDHTLAELCCSVGVSLEYLAPVFKKVIGVDIDQEVLETCKTNLITAGCIDKAEIICGDVFDDAVLQSIKADIVIYDIPFWYPYEQENKGNLIDKNPPLKALIEKIKKYVTTDIIIFSPPEWKYEYFLEELGECEYEKVIINGRNNRNQIYLGGLIQARGKTKIKLNTNL